MKHSNRRFIIHDIRFNRRLTGSSPSDHGAELMHRLRHGRQASASRRLTVISLGHAVSFVREGPCSGTWERFFLSDVGRSFEQD